MGCKGAIIIGSSNQMHDLRYVRLDVGGFLFTTLPDTLNKFPESILSKYVSPNNDTRLNSEEFIRIERDGRNFKTILNYMRDGKVPNLERWRRNDIRNIIEEANHYGLQELKELCESYLPELVIEEDKKHRRTIRVVYSKSALEKLLEESERPSKVFPFKFIRQYRIRLDAWLDQILVFCGLDYNLFLTKVYIMNRDFMAGLYPPHSNKILFFLRGFIRNSSGNVIEPSEYSLRLYLLRVSSFFWFYDDIKSTSDVCRYPINSNY